MSNHSWQRLETACLDPGAWLPLCSGARMTSVTSLKTMPAVNVKEKTLEYGPGSAKPPASKPWWCHSVSLWLALPAHSAAITQHGSSVVRSNLRPQLSWSEGKNNSVVIATSQTAAIVCDCYLNTSTVRKVLLDVWSFPCTQLQWQAGGCVHQLWNN